MATEDHLPEQLKTYATLNSALLRDGLAAAGRVWYLLRGFDSEGRGVVDVDAIRELLTGRRSPARLCGWRRMRQILNDGEGKLWERDEHGRIWLFSPARAAKALGCGRLRGRPVYIATASFLESLQKTKAELYASFESARPEPKKGADPSPVSRARLEQVTGVPRRTQRAYDAILGRKSKRNIAVTGIEWTPENRQEQLWKDAQELGRARPLHKVKDSEGRDVIGYQIASTRAQRHKPAPRGRQSKHNRRITLVDKGAQGNEPEIVQCYHPNGEAAAAAFNRNSSTIHFWPLKGGVIPNVTRRPRLEGVTLWGALCA